MKIPTHLVEFEEGTKNKENTVFEKILAENFPNSSQNTNPEPGSLTYHKQNKQKLLKAAWERKTDHLCKNNK